jgi:hypothetical protein
LGTCSYEIRDPGSELVYTEYEARAISDHILKKIMRHSLLQGNGKKNKNKKGMRKQAMERWKHLTKYLILMTT